MNPVYRNPFEIFFNRIFSQKSSSITAGTLLEIGCSSGEYLRYFEQYGLDSYGIDPSPLNSGGSENIISGMYERHELTQQYDVLVSRFNLEHLNDIHVFFRKAWNDLTHGGILFIQVPNIAVFTESFIPVFLAHEHIQYFNAYSLNLASRRHGFTVIDIEYSGTQSIMIALGKDSGDRVTTDVKKVTSDFFPNYLQKRSDVGNIIKSFLQEHKSICFYGAGMALCWIIYDLGYHNDSAGGIVIDDNPMVKNKFLPQTDFMIAPFDGRIVDKYPTILLTLNPAYHARIIKKTLQIRFQW